MSKKFVRLPRWNCSPIVSPRPRKFLVENWNCPKSPSSCEYPAPNWTSFRLVSSPFTVTSTAFRSGFTRNSGSSSTLKYPSWEIFMSPFLKDSMSRMSPSRTSSSRRRTFSRVSLFPVNSTRPSRYWSPSVTLTVTSTLRPAFSTYSGFM